MLFASNILVTIVNVLQLLVLVISRHTQFIRIGGGLGKLIVALDIVTGRWMNCEYDRIISRGHITAGNSSLLPETTIILSLIFNGLLGDLTIYH